MSLPTQPQQAPTPKLLITGISGFLGWHIAQVLQHQSNFDPATSGPVTPNQTPQQQWEIFGTYQTRTPSLTHVTCLPIDLTDFAQLQQLLQTIRPTAVIHTAAQAKPNLCQNDPIASHAINVTASVNLAGLCADANIPFVFTSTDLVFDGRHAPYRESDAVNPLSLYGEQKVLAEQGIGDRHPQATLCRMPLMFGTVAHPPSFLQEFLTRLETGEKLKLFTDEFRTPVSGWDAAQGLLLALEKQVKGHLHLGGKERISRYEFGLRMVAAFGLAESQLIASKQADLQMAAPRPADVSLDSSLAFSLGYNPRLVIDALQSLSIG